MPLQTVARVPSAAGPGTPESVVVQLPADMPPGAVQLEVTRSGCLSGAAPTLLLPTAQAAAELRTLERAGVRGEARCLAAVATVMCQQVAVLHSCCSGIHSSAVSLSSARSDAACQSVAHRQAVMCPPKLHHRPNFATVHQGLM